MAKKMKSSCEEHDPGMKLSAHMCEKAKHGGYPVTSIKTLRERAQKGDANAQSALRMRKQLANM